MIYQITPFVATNLLCCDHLVCPSLQNARDENDALLRRLPRAGEGSSSSGVPQAPHPAPEGVLLFGNPYCGEITLSRTANTRQQEPQQTPLSLELSAGEKPLLAAPPCSFTCAQVTWQLQKVPGVTAAQ